MTEPKRVGGAMGPREGLMAYSVEHATFPCWGVVPTAAVGVDASNSEVPPEEAMEGCTYRDGGKLGGALGGALGGKLGGALGGAVRGVATAALGGALGAAPGGAAAKRREEDELGIACAPSAACCVQPPC